MRLSVLLLILNLAGLAWIALAGDSPPTSPALRAAGGAPSSLRLLDELAGEASGERCYALGTFAATADSDRFVAALAELGYVAQPSLREVDAAPDYWVHLPPLASEAIALRRVEELKGRGIDAYLISGGDLAQGISLGLFSRRAEAESLGERLGGLGYAARIREVPRRYGEIWVDVTRAGKGAGWEDLLRKFPGLRQVEKSCETIARPELFP